MDDSVRLASDLAQVARLATTGAEADLRLLLARLIRRYRSKFPDLSAELIAILETPRSAPTRTATRPTESRPPESGNESAGLAILRSWDPMEAVEDPVLSQPLRTQLQNLIAERSRAEELRARGLEPASSAIFVGPPGVGKTRAARWIANQLGMPLYSLDLTAVMSSRLGQSGANLRYALDFAKSTPSVLFLDEIDSIAKKRADPADVGELKRLVTIMLQELDEWPSSSLLLAATNHPELVDPALWRRFGAEVKFEMPSTDLVKVSIRRFLRDDLMQFENYVETLSKVLDGRSFSDIERSVESMRKALTLGAGTPGEIVAEFVAGGASAMTRAERISFAVELAERTSLSQHQIARMTAVSRDTIRKHSKISSLGEN
ncbi:ATPase family associated with various cellular activities (AAA) [Agreia bicolorata]|uniref:ATPase family associated with various cellular activities (AAA) n=2 Tax=Agreia bicolorata TaxID=110935 RepID=A0A1T4WU08_9MICO|nr:ATPase family associated with various cellular activities (AAA) [Agreia bicolorata]